MKIKLVPILLIFSICLIIFSVYSSPETQKIGAVTETVILDSENYENTINNEAINHLNLNTDDTSSHLYSYVNGIAYTERDFSGVTGEEIKQAKLFKENLIDKEKYGFKYKKGKKELKGLPINHTAKTKRVSWFEYFSYERTEEISSFEIKNYSETNTLENFNIMHSDNIYSSNLFGVLTFGFDSNIGNIIYEDEYVKMVFSGIKENGIAFPQMSKIKKNESSGYYAYISVENKTDTKIKIKPESLGINGIYASCTTEIRNLKGKKLSSDYINPKETAVVAINLEYLNNKLYSFGIREFVDISFKYIEILNADTNKLYEVIQEIRIDNKDNQTEGFKYIIKGKSIYKGNGLNVYMMPSINFSNDINIHNKTIHIPVFIENTNENVRGFNFIIPNYYGNDIQNQETTYIPGNSLGVTEIIIPLCIDNYLFFPEEIGGTGLAILSYEVRDYYRSVIEKSEIVIDLAP